MNRNGVSLRGFLNINTLLCITVAFAACLRQMATIQSLAFFVAILIAVVIDFFHLRHPPRIFLNISAVGILAFTITRMRWDNVVTVFTEAVLLMVAVKMLEEKRPRDYLQILSMSALAVVSTALLEVGGYFLYFCFLISILIGLELLLVTWFSIQPDATLTRREARQTAGRGVVIWILMLPLCLGLFFLAPRVRVAMTPFQEGDNEGTYVGFSEQVELGSVKEIQMSGELAFRAEMEPVRPQQLYWRGLVLDIFDGTTRTPSRRRGTRGPYRTEGEPVTQHIFMEPGRHRAVFALDMPIQALGDGIRAAGENTFLRMNPRAGVRVNYTAHSLLSDVLIPANAQVNRNLYLQLPQNFSPRLRQAAEELTDGMSEREKILAILAYFAPPAFRYSLDDLPVTANALEAFVFSYRRGNCEYFASAMAAMLRSIGIPARLVAGYHGGVYNTGGGYYIVSQSNAHVWVEAWEEAEGCWRRYDPTPTVGDIGATDENEGYNIFSMYIDILNYRVQRLFLEYDRATQSEFFDRLRELLDNPGPAFREAGEHFLDTVRKLAPPLLGGVLAIGAILYLRRGRRRRENGPETVLLKDFFQAMKKHGYERPIGDGLEEFVASIRGEKEKERQLYGLASEFVRYFQPVYFGGRTLDKEKEITLRQLISEIRATTEKERV